MPIYEGYIDNIRIIVDYDYTPPEYDYIAYGGNLINSEEVYINEVLNCDTYKKIELPAYLEKQLEQNILGETHQYS